MAVGKRRDLRQMGHHDHLRGAGERSEPASELDRGPPTNPGVHLVEDERRDRVRPSEDDGQFQVIQLTGRLTRDPELVQLDSGSVCRMRLAVENMGRSETGYVDISTFGKAGEAAARVLSKGWLVAVDGLRLRAHATAVLRRQQVPRSAGRVRR